MAKMVAKATWTKAEEHYLRENATDEVEAIAEATGRTVAEVELKMAELGFTTEKRTEAAAKKRRKQALAGFAVGSGNNPNAGCVAMSGGRSLSDDSRAGYGPGATKAAESRANNSIVRHRNSIWRG